MNTASHDLESLSPALAASGQSLAEASGLSINALKVIYATAVGHLEAGRLESAAAGAFQLVSLDPRSEDHWALYGNTLMKLGRFAEAVTAWEMAMACTPRFATAIIIARTAVAIGKLDNAAEALLMARGLCRTPAHQVEFDTLVDAWYAAHG